MSILSSLRLTPEQVRKMVAAQAKQRIAPKEDSTPTTITFIGKNMNPVDGPSPRKGGKQKPSTWFWMWLVNLDPQRLFTVEDVMRACKKTRSATLTSIHAARNHGFVETAQKRNFNGDKSLYRRTMR